MSPLWKLQNQPSSSDVSPRCSIRLTLSSVFFVMLSFIVVAVFIVGIKLAISDRSGKEERQW
ncbi:unnamed protein product [Brassica oleracea]